MRAKSQEIIHFGKLRISIPSRKVNWEEEEIELTGAEFDLLVLLAKSAGNIVSREVIAKELTGIEYNGMDRSIDLKVSQLRKKLNDAISGIKTVRGKGYVFIPDAWG